MDNTLRRTFGASQIIDFTADSARLITVTVIPGSGDTLTVESTNSPNPNIATAVWVAWNKGAVTTTTRDVHVGLLTGLRLTRTVGATNSDVEVSYG